MKRWIQCNKCHKLIPAQEYDEHRGFARTSAHAVAGDIAEFVSPVDGTVISSRSALREHNKKHGVVSVAEYGGTHSESAKKERERKFLGNHTREESFKRKQAIHEIMNRLEGQ